MQLHIVSDGTGMDTYISTPGGQKLMPVSASINLEANAVNEAHLTFYATSVDVKALLQTVTIICPCCAESMTHQCQGAP